MAIVNFYSINVLILSNKFKANLQFNVDNPFYCLIFRERYCFLQYFLWLDILKIDSVCCGEMYDICIVTI